MTVTRGVNEWRIRLIRVWEKRSESWKLGYIGQRGKKLGEKLTHEKTEYRKKKRGKNLGNVAEYGVTGSLLLVICYRKINKINKESIFFFWTETKLNHQKIQNKISLKRTGPPTDKKQNKTKIPENTKHPKL